MGVPPHFRGVQIEVLGPLFGAHGGPHFRGVQIEVLGSLFCHMEGRILGGSRSRPKIEVVVPKITFLAAAF